MIWINEICRNLYILKRMYVCICKAVNDSAIKLAVSEGARSFRDLSSRTGCGTQCGSCVKLAREVMDQALFESGSPRSEVELQVVSLG